MNYEKVKGLSSFGKAVWIFSALLQDMTNAVLFRKFTVNAGIISSKNVPAVVLSIKRLFGNNEVIGMDMRSFLDLVKQMAEDEKTDYTEKGLNVKDFFTNKAKHKVDMGEFTIPSWAFPRAELDLLRCAHTIIDAASRFDSTVDKVAQVMRESGVPEEEVEKFTNNIRKGDNGQESTTESKTPPTLH